MTPIRLAVIGSLLAWACASAHAVPPRVATSVPDNGQTQIDPALAEIRVEFDQDMSPAGYSWVGGGPTFPKVTGKPAWVSPRICVLPVQLEPGREYRFAINSASAKNFRNTDGEPAEPYPVTFRTRGIDAAVSSFSPDDARRAVDELRSAIDSRYSYRDLRSVDWPSQFKEYEPLLLRAESPDGFARVAAKLLAPARDPHIWIVVNDLTIGTMVRDAPANYSLETLARIVPHWKQRSEAVATGRFDDETGYLLIASWDNKHAQDLAKLPVLLQEFATAKGLIVDVRPNSGGNEALAEPFASCFVDYPVHYAKHRLRDSTKPGGFTEPFERLLKPIPNGQRFRGRVAVLMGPANMSSAETFLLMMKRAAGAKLIGARSFGSSGNPQPIKLADGITVYLPSWQAMTADGALIEGIGIPPDVDVPTKPDDFRERDPVLDAALRWLRQ